MQVFISYSTENSNVANEVCEFLENNGNACFIAPRNIRTGFSYAEEIMRGIDEADVLILLLSKASNESPHVLREVERSVNARVPIITCKIEEVELSKSFEYFLMPFQWLDMEADRDYYRLLDAMNGLCASNEDVYVASSNQDYDEAEYEEEYEADDNSDYYVNDTAYDEESDYSSQINAGRNANSRNDKRRNNRASLYTLIGCIAAVILIAAIVIVLVVINKNAPTSNPAITADPNASINNGSVSNNDVNNGTGQNFNNGDNQNNITNVSIDDYSVGMSVLFGSYLGEAVEWQILEIDEGGNAEMIAANVITMKGFDGAESGKAGFTTAGRSASYYEQFSNPEYSEMYGTGRWMLSTLRTWLNSSELKVIYDGTSPDDASMDSGCNGYTDEAGFLSNFSPEERAALVLVTNHTKYYDMGDGSLNNYDITEDYVYLLASNEVNKITMAGLSYYTTPTAKAIGQNKSGYYNENSVAYGFDTIDWWLRDTSGSPSGVICMWNSYFDENMLTGNNANTGGCGVRPVIKVNLSCGLAKIVQ